MVAPSYSTDLLIVNTAETTTDWAELAGHTSGGSATYETDFYIQGSACVSQSTGSGKTGTVVGLQYSHTADLYSAFTNATGYCFFVWHVFLPANAIETWANGGIRFGVGSAAGDMYFWNSVGSDFGRNPYGGWQNIAIDPTYAGGADTTDGTPTGTNYIVFGSLPNITSSVAKGNPHGVDAIRYGRGEIYIEYGESTNGYGTFAGIATQNDNTSNRWGLFQAEGTGYLWKGLLSFGNIINACQFVDSNRNITVDNTPRTYSAFNKIEISNASSVINWTNINFLALNSSQLSKGDFEMVDNASVDMDGCSFTDMNTFIFDSNATIADTTFRRCAQVTQGGGTFSGCIFSNSTATTSLLCDDPDLVTDCTFASDGSNHALELTAATAGGSYSLSGHTFTGYATSDGSTGNETIYNNSGGAVTLNASGNTGSISVRNSAGSTTTIVADPVTTQITVKDLSTNTVIESARCFLYVTDGSNFPYNTSVSITGSGTTATVTHTAHGLSTNDNIWINGITDDDVYNGSYTITVSDVNTYTYTTSNTITQSSPSGSPTATFVFIDDVTNASGIVSDSRVVSTDQPVSGWVRKASSSPYYVQGNISDTVDSANGLSVTVLLARDE